MSKVVLEAKREGEVFQIVRYRVRRANDWVSHKIPMNKREVVPSAKFQDFQRWAYTDNGETVSIPLSVKLNYLVAHENPIN